VSPKTDPALLLNLAERLLDTQEAGGPLTPGEEAFLRQFSRYVYEGPDRLPPPTLIQPGPAKVEVLRMRLEMGYALWNKGADAEIAPEEDCEYTPLVAGGNFATIGRVFRAPGETP
jgi:hypothetical protein